MRSGAAWRSFKPAVAIALTAAVAMTAMYATRVFGVSPASFFPPSFVTHSVMLALSLAAMWLLSKGRIRRYGLTRGTYKFRFRILMWVLPTALLSTLAAVASPAGQGAGGPSDLTRLQIVVFVWVYASISEELLTRGLLQTLLSGNPRDRAPAPRGLSTPVIVSALFFGSMHIVLFKSMGPTAIPVILMAVFLGLIAARYRERTGSVIPAIIVHALFNIGGLLPLWMIDWLRG